MTDRIYNHMSKLELTHAPVVRFIRKVCRKCGRYIECNLSNFINSETVDVQGRPVFNFSVVRTDTTNFRRAFGISCVPIVCNVLGIERLMSSEVIE